jgi:hypothetical protein
MEPQFSDTLPLAALTIGQARQFIGGLVSHELEQRLKPQEPPRPLHDRMNARDAVQFLVELGYPTSIGTLYNRVANEDIPYLKIGKRLVFSREQLVEWVEGKIESGNSTNPALTLARSANRKK